jgi:1-acyl-sn-glycerol-3-phosphate acyltransferase
MKRELYLNHIHKTTFLYYLGFILSYIIFHFLFRRKVYGIEHIPKEGTFLICANHLSYFDPPCIGSSLPFRHIFYLARKTLFTSRLMGWLLPRIHAIPVDQEKSDIFGIRTTLQVLKAGAPLLLFPEGARSWDGQLQKGEPGTGMIALKSGVSILPVRIRGTFEAWPRGRSKIKLHPISVTFGTVLPPFQPPAHLSTQESYQWVSDRIMEAIAKL